MIAKDIISKNVTPIKIGDAAQKALQLMSEQMVKHLPVLEKGKLVGVLSEETLLNCDAGEKIAALPMNFAGKYVYCKDHIFEILKHMAEHNMSVMPVVKDDMMYFGIVTQDGIIKNFAQAESITEPGSIIVLETTKRNYSLAEISRIVENEGFSVIGLLITNSDNVELIDVAIKINTTNISAILAAFERYQYTIKVTYEENDYTDRIKDRFDSLMSYLNV